MKRRDLVPWKAFSKLAFSSDVEPFARLQNEMNRLFEGICSGLPGEFEKTSSFTPKIDITETEEAVHVRAELPGMTDKDIDITLNADALVLRGEKRVEDRKEEGSHVYFESSYGSFQRTVPLHCEIHTDGVDCSMKNGVLNLTLPKAPESKKSSRKISIRSES